MAMKRAIAISLTLLTCSAEANNLCNLSPANAEKTVKIKGVPGFFFKVHPDGDIITFIEAEHNTMVDLNTGAELPTVGNIDPVWSPDGKFLTHPGGGSEESEKPGKGKNHEELGLQFYPSKDIIEATKAGKYKDVKPVNSKLGGVYQSIGVNKDGSYNIISDQNGVSMGNFSYSAEGGPKLNGDIAKPCSNFPEMGTDLPMISKDGRFLSAYDQKSKSTKIYKLHGKECDLALDLGYGTGKVSFNKDSSQIAFHVDQFSDFQDGYFSGVGKDKIKNVVVLNIEETTDGKLKPSSWALASKNVKPGDGGYYPDFDKHGNLYFMEDIDNNFQFVKVSPRNLEFREMEPKLTFGKPHEHDAQCEASEATTDILAKMWKDVCATENKLPLDKFPELTSAIDPVECKKMVESFYVPELGTTKEELLKACPHKGQVPAKSVGEWNLNQKAEAEAIMKGKCITCHRVAKTYEATEELYVMTGPSTSTTEEITLKKKLPAFNLETMDKDLATQMLEAIFTGKMPKKEPLSAEQKTMVSQYLQKRMLDMPEPANGGNEYLYVRRYSEEALEVERQNILRMNPSVTGETKAYLISFTECMYGQKNCGLYLEGATKNATIEASSLPEADRPKFIENKLMEARCSNLIEVTTQQCQDWARTQKKK
jgi:hypothetical protein